MQNLETAKRQADLTDLYKKTTTTTRDNKTKVPRENTSSRSASADERQREQHPASKGSHHRTVVGEAGSSLRATKTTDSHAIGGRYSQLPTTNHERRNATTHTSNPSEDKQHTAHRSDIPHPNADDSYVYSLIVPSRGVPTKREKKEKTSNRYQKLTRILALQVQNTTT